MRSCEQTGQGRLRAEAAAAAARQTEQSRSPHGSTVELVSAVFSPISIIVPKLEPSTTDTEADCFPSILCALDRCWELSADMNE